MIRQKEKLRCVYCNKMGWKVGTLFYFNLFSTQLHCWLSICFTSIDFVTIDELLIACDNFVFFFIYIFF